MCFPFGSFLTVKWNDKNFEADLHYEIFRKAHYEFVLVESIRKRI